MTFRHYYQLDANNEVVATNRTNGAPIDKPECIECTEEGIECGMIYIPATTRFVKYKMIDGEQVIDKQIVVNPK